jgi:hypothetical protein
VVGQKRGEVSERGWRWWAELNHSSTAFSAGLQHTRRGDGLFFFYFLFFFAFSLRKILFFSLLFLSARKKRTKQIAKNKAKIK